LGVVVEGKGGVRSWRGEKVERKRGELKKKTNEKKRKNGKT
jgi:hypothetical protein